MTPTPRIVITGGMVGGMAGTIGIIDTTLITTRTTLRRLVIMARITTSGRPNIIGMGIPIIAKREPSLE